MTDKKREHHRETEQRIAEKLRSLADTLESDDYETMVQSVSYNGHGDIHEARFVTPPGFTITLEIEAGIR